MMNARGLQRLICSFLFVCIIFSAAFAQNATITVTPNKVKVGDQVTVTATLQATDVGSVMIDAGSNGDWWWPFYLNWPTCINSNSQATLLPQSCFECSVGPPTVCVALTNISAPGTIWGEYSPWQIEVTPWSTEKITGPPWSVVAIPNLYFASGSKFSFNMKIPQGAKSGLTLVKFFVAHVGSNGLEISNETFTAGFIVESPPKITINASPRRIFPYGLGWTPTTSDVHVTVTDDDDNPVISPQKLIFQISVPRKDTGLNVSSLVQHGGHAHSGNRPLGTIETLSSQYGHVNRTIHLIGNSSDSTSFQASTDSSGNLYMTYRASPLSSVIKIQANPTAGTLDTDIPNFAYVTTGVLLAPLPDNPQLYTKIGGTPTHPGPTLSGAIIPGGDLNHYGDPNFIQQLISVASSFKGYCQTYHCPQTLSDEIQNETFLVNDISLPWGGEFDIKGNWKPPHLDHREGRAADVDLLNSPLTLSPNSLEAKALKDTIKRQGLDVYPESTHWHIQVMPNQR